MSDDVDDATVAFILLFPLGMAYVFAGALFLILWAKGAL